LEEYNTLIKAKEGGIKKSIEDRETKLKRKNEDFFIRWNE